MIRAGWVKLDGERVSDKALRFPPRTVVAQVGTAQVRAHHDQVTYEVYALSTAHHARRAAENFIGGDPHDGPMPLTTSSG